MFIVTVQVTELRESGVDTRRGSRQDSNRPRSEGSDAVLVTVDAGGHGVLTHPSPNACAIGAMTSYLVNGNLPAKDEAGS